MRVWFITGASRGFGALVSKAVLDAGGAVVATARNPRAIIDAVGNHPRLLTIPLDVTKASEAEEAANTAVRRFGRIDVLFNNAGYGLLGAVEEATAEEIETLYRTNVFGLLAVTRAVLPHMRARRSGHVLNMSSIGGYIGHQGWGVYCSTKFAVEGLTEALAIELAPLGIRATVIEPGFFRTDFLDSRSLTVSLKVIEDYHATSGAMRDFATEANHNQPGDPARFAMALLDMVESPDPPGRMPFGSDTVRAIAAKNAMVDTELTRWQALAVSTDYPVGSADAA
ncbi:MAG: oxidoreductase [Inquilinus sp.]|uniref:oxidoreductase n=1 Tax=Inquilinus sp. TaxID=1932117 RepID=UPI003F2B9903